MKVVNYSFGTLRCDRSSINVIHLPKVTFMMYLQKKIIGKMHTTFLTCKVVSTQNLPTTKSPIFTVQLQLIHVLIYEITCHIYQSMPWCHIISFAKLQQNFDIYKYISKNLGFLRNLIHRQQKQERNQLANLHQNGRKQGIE